MAKLREDSRHQTSKLQVRHLKRLFTGLFSYPRQAELDALKAQHNTAFMQVLESTLLLEGREREAEKKLTMFSSHRTKDNSSSQVTPLRAPVNRDTESLS